MAVHAGDRLDTTSGALRLRFADEETELDLRPRQPPHPARGPGRREVRLETGAVAATVAKQSAGRALVFVTTQAEAWVVGTRLALKTGSGSPVGGQRGPRALPGARRRHTPGGLRRWCGDRRRPAGCAATTSRRWPPVCCRQRLPVGRLAARRGGRRPGARRPGSRRRPAAFRQVVHRVPGLPRLCARDGRFPSAAQRAWAEEGGTAEPGDRLDAAHRRGAAALRQDVADGAYDAAYVDVLAREAAAWGQPLFSARPPRSGGGGRAPPAAA